MASRYRIPGPACAGGCNSERITPSGTRTRAGRPRPDSAVVSCDNEPRKSSVRTWVHGRYGGSAPIEQTRSWKRRYRFRNGCEGRISQLKRKGLARTRLGTLAGAQTWVGGIALSHNLQRMALLS